MPSPAPLRLLFDVQGELLEAAVQCETDVFLARFGNTPQELADAFAKYAEDTHYLTVIDPAGAVLACARLVFPGTGGLPTLDSLALPPWNFDSIALAKATEAAGLDLDRTMDGSTIAVRDGLMKQGFAASHALLYGMFAAMAANGLTSMLGIIDVVPIQLLRAAGLIFTPIPGVTSRPYFGSPDSTPMYAHLAELLATQQRLAPLAYQAIGRGIGLAGVELPSIGEFTLR